MTDAADDLAELAAWHRAGGRLALLFDYDGTLTPIVGHPSEAVLSPATRDLLVGLAAVPRVVAGVVSGRSLDDLRSMVDLPGLHYAGTAGLELEFPSGRIEHPEAHLGRKLVLDLTHRLEPPAAACPGAWIERKPLGLTIHYRASAAEDVERLRLRLAEILQPMLGQLRVLAGPRAVELTPALGWTKATAVRKIIDSVGPSRPLYAGDAENDADALALADELGGVALGIGPTAPDTARRRLPDPEALIAELTRLWEAIRESPARSQDGATRNKE